MRHGPEAKAASTAGISSGRMATHYFPLDKVHYTWDTGNEPVLTVADGDTVVFETRDVFGRPDRARDSDVERDRRPATGTACTRSPGRSTSRAPQPGDTLAVEIARRPHQGLGLDRDPARTRPAGRRLHRALPARSSTARPATCTHVPRGHPGSRSRRSWARWASARPTRSAQPIMPPGTVRRQHGHAPVRRRHRRSTCPVQVEGALVQHRRRPLLPGRRRDLRHRAWRPRCTRRCASGVREARRSPSPQYRTAPGSLTPKVDHGAWFATTGVGPDLLRERPERHPRDDRAPRRRPTTSHARTRTCSAALVVDLKISEIVDAGQYVVSAVLPESIFVAYPVSANGGVAATVQ